MTKVLIFAGTTEGRLIVDQLCSAGLDVHVCVATAIGGMMLEGRPNLTVSTERLDEGQMTALIREGSYTLVIDATHPYAALVSKNIKAACSQADTDYLRVLRPKGACEDFDDIITVPDTDAAVEFLRTTEGNILVTTGSKELSKFTRIEGYKERVFARVLSEPSVARACAELGFQGRNLISMQGPFCEELNYGMIKEFDARYMVTKDSGSIGGFEDKIRAARRAKIETVLISRPTGDSGLSPDEAIVHLSDRFGHMMAMPRPAPEGPITVSIIGAGMGDWNLTLEAEEDCRMAEVIFGAPRMATLAARFPGRFVDEYRAEGILEHLRDGGIKRAAVLYSGDIWLFSGARKMVEALYSGGFDVRLHNGISSMAYACSKMSVPYEEVSMVSLHGRDTNISGEVRRSPWTFLLLDGQKSITRFCQDLIDHGLSDVKVIIGEDLGYESERFVEGSPEEILGMSFGKLCTALVRNDGFDPVLPIGIRDDRFLRRDAPMTKKEVRVISISNLGLCEDSVVYDVGAGTGSVSIEMARIAFKGEVYAIEMDEDSASLIEENSRHLQTPNVRVIRGMAPEMFDDLPVPTHAFVGGSCGNLGRIVESLFEKNPDISIVINTVTLETLSEVLAIVKSIPEVACDIVQLSVSYAQELGSYRMMKAQNPIHIISINCR